jgi:hypothetical protein
MVTVVARSLGELDGRKQISIVVRHAAKHSRSRGETRERGRALGSVAAEH